jgi:hypothetical protein
VKFRLIKAFFFIPFIFLFIYLNYLFIYFWCGVTIRTLALCANACDACDGVRRPSRTLKLHGGCGVSDDG